MSKKKYNPYWYWCQESLAWVSDCPEAWQSPVCPQKAKPYNKWAKLKEQAHAALLKARANPNCPPDVLIAAKGAYYYACAQCLVYLTAIKHHGFNDNAWRYKEVAKYTAATLTQSHIAKDGMSKTRERMGDLLRTLRLLRKDFMAYDGQIRHWLS